MNDFEIRLKKGDEIIEAPEGSAIWELCRKGYSSGPAAVTTITNHIFPMIEAEQMNVDIIEVYDANFEEVYTTITIENERRIKQQQRCRQELCQILESLEYAIHGNWSMNNLLQILKDAEVYVDMKIHEEGLFTEEA